MVRSTKRCLKKIIGRARLTYDELLTSLIEVEMVINSHPLTYVSPDDLQEPPTAHFLFGRRLLTLPDGIGCGDDTDDEDFDLTHNHLTKLELVEHIPCVPYCIASATDDSTLLDRACAG
jgi:hypothetical protein